MRLKKLLSAVALATALLMGGSVTATACTGVYVGKDVSATGYAYVCLLYTSFVSGCRDSRMVENCKKRRKRFSPVQLPVRLTV